MKNLIIISTLFLVTILGIGSMTAQTSGTNNTVCPHGVVCAHGVQCDTCYAQCPNAGQSCPRQNLCAGQVQCTRYDSVNGRCRNINADKRRCGSKRGCHQGRNNRNCPNANGKLQNTSYNK